MANYEYLTTTGAVVPDTATIQDEVIAEYKAVFGDDLTTNPETPEGRLIEAEVTSRASVVRNNAKLANQINPNFSFGTFLDAVLALTNDARTVAKPSTVQCDVTGVEGTVILAGSRASDDSNQVWVSAADITIGAGGTASGSFQSEETGPISAGAGTINAIVDDTLGWETIINPSAATLGTVTESDSRARQGRRIKLALNARSIAAAVQANLATIDGYRSHTFRENETDQDKIIDGALVVKNSVWVTVDGGIDQDIAEALYESKSGGCNWNGDQEVFVTDEVSGQNQLVKFYRPTDVPVLVRLTVKVRPGLEPTEEIVQFVLDYANGDIDGERGFVVGEDVSAFEIGSAVNISIPDIFVASVEVAYKGGTPVYSAGPLDISIGEKATLLSGDILVTVL